MKGAPSSLAGGAALAFVSSNCRAKETFLFLYPSWETLTIYTKIPETRAVNPKFGSKSM